MMKMVKSLVLALSLFLTPTIVTAQEVAPAATAQTDTAAAATDSAIAADSSYERMKPTKGIGMPVDKGMDFQPVVTETGKYAKWINNAILLPISAVISLFVLGLLLWVMVRYRKSANPNPSKTTHNTLIEILWTGIPVLILAGIAVPSIDLLADQYKPAPEDAITVKATGYQWYWGYTYADNGGFEVIANMSTKEEADANEEPFLLATDNRLVLPVGVPIRLIVTSADVIHSFSVPAFWYKLDAVPGRLNEKALLIEEPGVYYGQCSELCGARHGYMPIAVEALPLDKYNAWVRSQGGTAKGESADEGAADEAEAPAAVTTVN